MTFYSEILESALCDVIPIKMGYGRNLVYEMISEVFFNKLSSWGSL